MRTMRIACLCHNFEINGANIFIETLTHTFLNFSSLSVFSPRDGKMRDRFHSKNVETKVLRKEFDFRSLKEYDLVIINSLMMARAVIECVKLDIPHIFIIHESWLPEKMNYYLNDLWNIDGITDEEIFQALKTSNQVVYPAKFLEDIYGSLVCSNRRKTIYCTIDMAGIDRFRDEYLCQRASLRKSLGIGEEDIVFLQVGTVTRRKAQMSSLDAFIRLKSKYKVKNAKLIFVGARSFRPGEKDYLDNINKKIIEYGLEDDVRIYDVQENVNKFFLVCDSLVHPSINEVLPLAILEACYFELPVIVSNLDGMPEIIVNNKNGFLVNPFDTNSICSAMLALVKDPMLRARLGAHARKEVVKQHAQKVFNENYSHLVQYVTECYERAN